MKDERVWHVYSEDGVVLSHPRPVGKIPKPPRGARCEWSTDGDWVEVYTKKRGAVQPEIVYVALGGQVGRGRR